jgi:hypothetical protein
MTLTAHSHQQIGHTDKKKEKKNEETSELHLRSNGLNRHLQNFPYNSQRI